MEEMKKIDLQDNNLKINVNATATKRINSFALDLFFVSIFRYILLKIFVFTEKHREIYNITMEEFNNLFGKLEISTIADYISSVKDYHIRYLVNSVIFKYAFNTFIIVSFAGVLYNFLCYLFFNGTIGQKLLSLKLVNLKNKQNANIIKKLIKAIFVPLPFVSVFILFFFFIMLYTIQFHIYAPIENNFCALIVANITSISNPFVVILLGLFFILFWYGFYLLNNSKLLLSDILSGTKVIDKNKEYRIESILDNKQNESKNDFVYFMDKLLDYIGKCNEYLKKLLKKQMDFLKKKIKK